MGPLDYCLDCQRVFVESDNCPYCSSANVKALKKGTSVNIIGTKSKGKVVFCKKTYATLLLNNERNEKYVKDFEPKFLKKIL